MSSLKQKYGNAKGRLTRARDFVNTITISISLEMLEIRFKSLNQAWVEFCEFYNTVLETAEASEIENYESEYSDYESRFFEAHAKLLAAIRQKQSGSKPDSDETIVEKLAKQQTTLLEKLNVTSERCSIQLPKLIVAPFSGDYKDWPSFRDSFTGSVDQKENLTAIQKFHYLKSFLRDRALDLIKHIPLTEANYFEAWERLENRYDRSQLIVQSFIETYLSLPNAVGGNVKVLRQITDTADEVIRGLNAINVNNRDPWLIHLLLTKLDIDTKQSWAEKIGTRDDATIDELLMFLESRCNALESCQSVVSRPSVSRNKQQSHIRSHFVESSQGKSIVKCPKCKEEHNLPQCPQFIALDIESRRSFAKSNSLCFNCLRTGHGVSRCNSSFRCRECRSRHHTLVHSSSQIRTIAPLQSNLSSSNQVQDYSTASIAPILNNLSIDKRFGKQTILPTILAQVEDYQGNFQSCRILIDSGSQVSFAVESFIQRLGLPRKHARIPIVGVSSADAGHTKGYVSIKLVSRIDKTQLVIDAFILSKLTSNLPSQPFDPSHWAHIKGLDLADPSFNVPGSIDVLLGADRLWSILKGQQVQGPKGVPIAQHTSFGWVITGELSNPLTQSTESNITALHSVLDVDVLLQRFWELDEVKPHSENSINEDQAERHFHKTFSRASDGKYVVQLPFKEPRSLFGDSLKLAINRLYSMEKRFQRDKMLHESYLRFMQEYISLGHMAPIPSDEIDSPKGKYFYLPHHAIFKPDSVTTKLRVVFDGSAKDSLGISLNSQLLIGPPIQRNLFAVCLRFRQHKYVFTADVVKMFRQIWVEDEHTDFQRIVWRENPNEEIGHFRLKTVTYGTASAPFLAVRVLKQIAIDYKSQFPLAADVLLRDVYVDDIMTGANSIEDLLNLQSQLVSLLSKAQLELRKWNSNCWPLLARLPKDDCDFSWFNADCSKTTVRVLGLHWSPTSDEFSFRVSNSLSLNPPTRRSLLSEISRIFDPLGFLAPSVILFKILFQELWSYEIKLGWDDPLPVHLTNKWLTYRKELIFFEEVRIPRNIFFSLENIEYHGFSDASSVAYSAVIYVRCKVAENEYKTILTASKTKVAPLKPVSIPRLELCAALLLSRLLQMIKSSITCEGKMFAWCDSQIVLHWLSSPPRRWTSFVANRTATILEMIPRHSWNYIASESNPADCASRGVLPSALRDHQLWWNGPTWLSLPQNQWPTTRFITKLPNAEDISAEEKPTTDCIALLSRSESHSISHDIILLAERVSTWNRLIRVVATCIRYTRNLQPNKFERRYDGLSYNEIQRARICVLKNVQIVSFGSDMRYLSKNLELPSKSKLLRYAPFIDEEGLLRVGGRLTHANVSFNLKHPIILPNNIVSLLIARDIHENHLHPGLSQTFAIIRQRYWILGSRTLIRNVVYRCKTCFLQRKTTSSQLMGNLPLHRVHPARAFTNTGCDYAGPFSIKLSKGRNPKLSKAYFAIFVCMSTKAIHLELVSDLTTNAFLAAFKRFVARRGKCSNIYSDNGTNFQGARRCLNEMQKLVVSQAHNEEIAASLAMDGTAWHFIPPSAPHFGGLWEAGVKSVKLHLRRVVGSSLLTFEDLYTVLTQIESILNSRPICDISDDDLNPLTPAHFLIGEPFTAIPEPNYCDVPTNRLSHWQHLQSMVQGFWKRWQSEYITSLQERPKWQRREKPLLVGDLVIIKESNQPPSKWKLGRIEAVHPGLDNLIRVATVRTSNGTYVRSITKLAPLPKS